MAADMLASEVTLQAATWLFTYLIHSTLLLGGAWAATRSGLIGGPDGREALWKVALVAGLVTATVQVGLGSLNPAADNELRSVWAYKAEEPQAAVGRGIRDFDVMIRRRVGMAAGAQPMAAVMEGSKRIKARITEPNAACLAALRQPGLPLDQRVRDAAEVCAGSGFNWHLGVLIMWGVGAALLLVRLMYTRVLLRAALVGKVPVDAGEARDILDALLQETGVRQSVRLTAAAALESPAVVGPREICLPMRAQDGLTASELRLVLAHELGHVARRDLFWTTLSRLLGAMLFFQPLNRLALREIEAEAEFLCDDWAVEHTGDPVVLARSLTRISEWLTRPSPAPVLAMVRSGGSPLLRRVQRILAPASERPRTSRVRLLVLVVLLLGLTSVAPRVNLPGNATFQLISVDGELGPPFGLSESDLSVRGRRAMVFVRAVEVEAGPTP